MKVDLPDDSAVIVTVQVPGRRALQVVAMRNGIDWDDPNDRRWELLSLLGSVIGGSPVTAALHERLGREPWPKTKERLAREKGGSTDAPEAP